MPKMMMLGMALLLAGCAGYGVVAQPGGYCSPIGGVACDAGSYCKLTTGQCAVAAAGGSCVAVPASCPNSNAPVCGCDGNTYKNACEASKNRTSVAYEGGCYTREQPK